MSVAEEREARSVALEKAYVHEVYEQISGSQYPGDGQRGRAWPKVKQFLSELEPGSLVCDVGCGNGKYLNVNPSVFKVGADRCCSLTEVAREKEHEVLMCDNLSLPFRDESFDAVLSVAVVHHFATTERRVGALRELARVLRIGGRLIISVWAMEQRHRKFESQDVLVPWHRPQHLSTPSLELTSTTTTTSEDDGPPPYHAYTQTSDSDSCRSARPGAGQRKRGRSRHKGRSIDPARPTSGSQSSSSLSSPNETCYSFVRRALQKLAGGKRGGSGHRPWFLDSWSSCTKEPAHRYDPDGCEDGEGDAEDIHDLPIELRRLEEEQQHEVPQRRQTFACTRRATPHEGILNHKSKSLSDILTVGQRAMVRSRSSVPSLGGGGGLSGGGGGGLITSETKPKTAPVVPASTKPRLVKQKKSLCEEELEEDGDEPTDMRDLVKALPEFKVTNHGGSRRYGGGVFKQSSMNEELMSTERLREKERVRQNIQKQASLNEELIYRRHRTLDSLRDTLFSTSTAKRFQLLKNGLTSKLKSSTTGIEKVAGTSFKNGFVRILQGWKGGEVSPMTKPPPTPTSAEGLSPRTPPPDGKKPSCCMEDKKDGTKPGERRHSREDGSDSSKDSSLQSDTSVDSEDSFASVIFVPKPDQQPADPTAPTSATPSQLSPPKSPQPTSPKVKVQPPPPPPPPPPLPPPVEPAPLEEAELPVDENELAAEIKHNERLRQIQEMLRARVVPGTNRLPGGGSSTRTAFPLVRRSSALVLGRPEPLARPLPRLLSLELFNPETDDMDSDSSGVSSPDSVSSVISVLTEELAAAPLSHTHGDGALLPAGDAPVPDDAPPLPPDQLPPKGPEIVDLLLEVDAEPETSAPAVSPSSLSLLEAAADVASSLEDAVDAVIQSSPRARRRKLQLLESADPLAVLQGGGCGYGRRLSPRRALDLDADHESWDESCRQHLADFAEKLSEKLLEEIDQYRKQTCQPQPRPAARKIFAGLPEGYEHIDDPYLSKLSEELEDLTKLSEELQKRNSFIASLNETSQSESIGMELQDSIWKSKRDPINIDPFISPESPNIHRDFLDKDSTTDTNLILTKDKLDDYADVNLSTGSDVVPSENSAHSDPLTASDVSDCYSRQTSADITEDLETCVVESELMEEDDLQPPTVVENLSVCSLRRGFSVDSNDTGETDKLKSNESISSIRLDYSFEGCDTRNSEKPKSSEDIFSLGSCYSNFHQTAKPKSSEDIFSWKTDSSLQLNAFCEAVQKQAGKTKSDESISLRPLHPVGSDVAESIKPKSSESIFSFRPNSSMALGYFGKTETLQNTNSLSSQSSDYPAKISNVGQVENLDPITLLETGMSMKFNDDCKTENSRSMPLLRSDRTMHCNNFTELEYPKSISLGADISMGSTNGSDPAENKMSPLHWTGNCMASTKGEDVEKTKMIPSLRTNTSIDFGNGSDLGTLKSIPGVCTDICIERSDSGEPEKPKSIHVLQRGISIESNNGVNSGEQQSRSALRTAISFESSDGVNQQKVKGIPLLRTDVSTESSDGGDFEKPRSTPSLRTGVSFESSDGVNQEKVKVIPLLRTGVSTESSDSEKPRSTPSLRAGVSFESNDCVNQEKVKVIPLLRTGVSTESSDSEKPRSTPSLRAGVSFESNDCVNQEKVKGIPLLRTDVSTESSDSEKPRSTPSLRTGVSFESSDGGESEKLKSIPLLGTGISIESSDGGDSDKPPPKCVPLLRTGHSFESSDGGGDSEKPKSTPSLRTGASTESSDDKRNSLRPGHSMESSDADTGKTASTASLGPESSDDGRDARYADRRTARCDGRSSSEEAPPRMMLVRQRASTQEPPEPDSLPKTESCASSLSGSTSQESLPSDNGGGAITFHRYYHVFREGELDQLIERYVENLHIISSYYDHANWVTRKLAHSTVGIDFKWSKMDYKK